jgi:hypothetical protein
MRAAVTLYSKVFLETNDDTWSARPNNALLRRLHSGEGSARWISQISDSYISIGDPVPGDEGNIMYLPQWFMESAGIEDGSEAEIEFTKSEELPRATSLTFRMMGPGQSDVDIRDLLEEPLSQLGVLQVGQIIPVPTLEGSMLLLESCDPDGVVFLDGAEIALNIINEEVVEPLATFDEQVGGTPLATFGEQDVERSREVVEPVATVEAYEDDSLLPVYTPAPAARTRFPPKFIPFQGVGHTLGS